ncbi:hypothetical protein PIROE2DRAFT_15657 [Piromyces sp. E2]|nr:hypothetical protein PIROE2DRAFT_15657 [Piromyces sp. E2]|eukprot:OUM58947.1 hypothetical protein PIROE2DRAFT_15657 [Piromyces sp. E2]
MAELDCRDGGEASYVSAKENGKIYGGNYVIEMINSNLVKGGEIEKNLEEFCNKYSDTVAFLDEIKTKCSNPFREFPLNYIYTQFYGKYYCSKDASNGELCYKSFGAAAVAELPIYNVNDTLYSENIKNPPSCCGADDGTVGSASQCQVEFIGPNTTNATAAASAIIDKVKATPTSSTSDAVSLSAQVSFLSLILCIIFALFK